MESAPARRTLFAFRIEELIIVFEEVVVEIHTLEQITRRISQTVRHNDLIVHWRQFSRSLHRRFSVFIAGTPRKILAVQGKA